MQASRTHLFKNGHSQAVRIPKVFEFKGVDQVEVSRDGDTLVLRPVRKSWLSFAELPAAGDDFLPDRVALLDVSRVVLDQE